MPTIPLYRTDVSDPDASHDVRAPGGYEWWYFDAEDPSSDRQIVIILLNGFIFHPGYLRAHQRYLKRPTRVAPALPQDFACAYFVIYERGKVRKQFMTQYPAKDFVASTSEPDVRIGPNTMRREPDGSFRVSLTGTPWQLTGRGPKLLAEETLAAELTFQPRLPARPMERIFLSRAMTGADHHWVIAAPRCDVAGSVRADGAEFRFNGRGYHDHNYGSAPIGRGLKRWIWGRVLTDDRAATFHLAIPRDARLPEERHVVTADASGVSEAVPAAFGARFDRLTALGLAYPSQLDLSESLTIRNPRVLDASPFYMRLMYEAQLAGKSATAFCEVAYPHRLLWPILGRMIEMSIDKRAIGLSAPQA